MHVTKLQYSITGLFALKACLKLLHDLQKYYSVLLIKCACDKRREDLLLGERYLGMWVNDMRNGCGTLVGLDGVCHEGMFEKNRLVVSLLESACRKNRQYHL